jgi:hypothetical protein
MRSILEGVSLGLGKRETKIEKTLADTIAGIGRRAPQSRRGEQRRLAEAERRGVRLRRLQPQAGAQRAGEARGRVPAWHHGDGSERGRQDQRALGARAREDEGVRHREGAHAAADACAAMQSKHKRPCARSARRDSRRVSALTELRDPGQRGGIDRDVRRIGWQVRGLQGQMASRASGARNPHRPGAHRPHRGNAHPAKPKKARSVQGPRTAQGI